MENTIKNMELILDKALLELSTNGNIQAVKTLMNTYRTLLAPLSYQTVSGKYLDTFRSQKILLTELKSSIDEKISSKINHQDYKSADNLAIASDRVAKSLGELATLKFKASHTIEIKQHIVDDVINELLELSVKSGTLITLHDEMHRGMGKTTALIKKAHELDAVLIVGLPTQMRYVSDLAKEMGLSVSVATTREASLTQYRNKMNENGYLVDELLDKEVLTKLKNFKLLGGFQRIVI
jgi:hypothetical protein